VATNAVRAIPSSRHTPITFATPRG
jgi:hypothetical protein